MFVAGRVTLIEETAHFMTVAGTLTLYRRRKPENRAEKLADVCEMVRPAGRSAFAVARRSLDLPDE